jgi:hypothetical protein
VPTPLPIAEPLRLASPLPRVEPLPAGCPGGGRRDAYLTAAIEAPRILGGRSDVPGGWI